MSKTTRMVGIALTFTGCLAATSCTHSDRTQVQQLASKAPSPAPTTRPTAARPTLQVTPQTVSRGEGIVATFTGCLPDPGSKVSVLLFDSAGLAQPNNPGGTYSEPVTAHADGSGVSRFTVPTDASAGRAMVEAQCAADTGNALAYVTVKA